MLDFVLKVHSLFLKARDFVFNVRPHFLKEHSHFLKITTVAGSVTFEAAGNKDKLMSSNYELYKTGDGQPPVLGHVKGFKLMDGDMPGSLKLMCDGVKSCRSYTDQITADPMTPDSAWQSVSTTKEYTFTNLGSSKKFWCRILAIGTKGQVSVSEPLSRVTQ